MTPTLLVPGLLCTAEMFAAQIPALWSYGPVTVASTLYGETIAEIAANILASAPPQFALVGISMGGYICFEIMRQAPERVLKLALLDTSARPDTSEQSEQRRQMLNQGLTRDFERFLARVLTAILHPAHQQDEVIRATQVRMGLAVGREGFQRQTEAVIGRIDSRPHLGDIKVPTLVLVGDRDPLTPVRRSEEITALIPNAKLVEVPECGHASTLEQPEAVNRALVEWLEGSLD